MMPGRARHSRGEWMGHVKGTRMFKAAFFDIDGTLVGFKDHRVPASAWRAIDALRARGVKVMIATGRSPAEIVEELREGFDCYITLNGQYCHDGEGVFREVRIDEADVRAIVDGAQEGLYDILLMQHDRSMVNRLTPRIREVGEMVDLDYRVGDVVAAASEPVYQFNVFVDAADEHLFLDRTRGVEVTRWTDLFCDVVPRGGGKHLGVRAALERFGIAPEEAIAFGDGENDLSMFAEVGTSVAMGNAWEPVKKRATYVTTGVDDDGIWNACRHLGLV